MGEKSPYKKKEDNDMCYELPLEPEERKEKGFICEYCEQEFWEGLEFQGWDYCDEVCLLTEMRTRGDLKDKNS